MDVRKDFPCLDKKAIYLDSAATCHKPTCVIETVRHFYENSYATVHRAAYPEAAYATASYFQVRQAVCDFIHAAYPEEIIFTKGTTESLNLVAWSYGRSVLGPGDEVVVSHTEHHANLVPWQILCKETGAHLKYIPVDDRGVLCIESFSKLISKRTKVVSIAQIANATGICHPIAEIVRITRLLSNAKVCVDGAQSAAHMAVDVQALDVDFFAFSSHKAYGPTGLGVLYGKKELLESMPPYQSGGDMIETVTLEGATYQPPPLRFEAGTPPIAQVMGLGSALAYIEKIGLPQIARYENELVSKATQALYGVSGLRIIGDGPEKGSIISFSIEGIHPLDLGTLLGARGISLRTGHLCAQPTMARFGVTALSRISFAVYNSLKEVDVFMENLYEVVDILR